MTAFYTGCLINIQHSLSVLLQSLMVRQGKNLIVSSPHPLLKVTRRNVCINNLVNLIKFDLTPDGWLPFDMSVCISNNNIAKMPRCLMQTYIVNIFCKKKLGCSRKISIILSQKVKINSSISEGHETSVLTNYFFFHLEFHLFPKICSHFLYLQRSRYSRWFPVESPHNHRYPSGSFENTSQRIMGNNYQSCSR